MLTMSRKFRAFAVVLAFVAAVTLVTSSGGVAEARGASTAYYDRNGGEITVGMFVNVPCLITAITPSLNPALTSVTVRTLPNVGSTEYDEGLELIVYPSQILKR
jgi:hypothetical protein